MQRLLMSTKYIVELLEAGYEVQMCRNRLTGDLECRIEKSSCGAMGTLRRPYDTDDLCIKHFLRNIVIELDNKIKEVTGE